MLRFMALLSKGISFGTCDTMEHHFHDQVSSFADEGKSVRQTPLRSGVPGFLQLLRPTGIPASSREGVLLLTLSLTHHLMLHQASLWASQNSSWDVSHGVLGCVGTSPCPMGGICSRSSSSAPSAPRHCFPWQNPLPDMDAPSCPMCATHFQLQKGAWWEQVGSEIEIKYLLMQSVTANPQLEQAHHYSNNKRGLSNLRLVQPWPGRNCAQWREWQQNFFSSLWNISTLCTVEAIFQIE